MSNGNLNTTEPTTHGAVSLVVVAIWTCCILLALLGSNLSASAGRLPDRWVGVGMTFGLLNAGLVVVGFWFLPWANMPRLVLRLAQLVGMAGAFWSAGTLTRAIYALSV